MGIGSLVTINVKQLLLTSLCEFFSLKGEGEVKKVEDRFGNF